MYEWDFGDEDIIWTTNSPFYNHTYEAPGVYTVVLHILDDEGFEDSVSLDLTVVQVSVDSVGFTGDHMIKKWVNNQDIDNPDGSDPVWTSGINDTDPVCYTKNVSPIMFAKFTVEPSVPEPGVSGVSIRVKVDETIIGSASGCRFRATAIEDSLNTDGDVDRIGGGSAIPQSDGVKTLIPTFAWEVSFDGTIWFPIGSSGPHTMYFIDSGPSASPLYDKGLEKACGYVDGDTDIAGKINTGLAAELYYDPTEETHHDLHIFDTGYYKGQCCCHAAVFSLLVSHVTSSNPSLVYLWGGCSSSVECHYIYGVWWGPTFKCDSPAIDGAPNQPHFTFHVEVDFGTVYDPSYGTTGLTTFLETAPALDGIHPIAATRQTGSGLPGSRHMVPWTCNCPD
jgi:PKD repeat protein